MWEASLHSAEKSVTTGNGHCYLRVIRFPSRYLCEIMTPFKYIAKFAELLCSRSGGYFNETEKLRNHYGKTPASDEVREEVRLPDTTGTKGVWICKPEIQINHNVFSACDCKCI